MEESNNLIDQLEDKLIDHPECAPLQTQTVQATSQEDMYQYDLKERASQILNGNWGLLGGGASSGGKEDLPMYSFLLSRPILHYSHRDSFGLRLDLTEWFVSADLAEFLLLRIEKRMDFDNAAKFGFHPSLNLLRASSQVDLLYGHVLAVSQSSSEKDHLARITVRCAKLIQHELLDKVLVLLCNSLLKYIAKPNRYSGKAFGANIHKLTTIVYVLVCVVATSKQKTERLANALLETDLLVIIPRLIESWKQHPTNTIRVRNFFLLLYKLILFEFGDSSHLEAVESLLDENHLLQAACAQSAKELLLCSPLDYFSLKEDLHDKYPLSDMCMRTSIPPRGPLLEAEREEFMAMNSHSKSMTNLLDAPRTNRAHTVMAQLPVQTLHISTPVSPSPTTPSDFMSGGEKVRKIYHVNQGMPLIYPFTPQQPVPQAVLEAKSLLDSTVRQNYAFKQLHKERLAFMKQERGICNGYDEPKSDTTLEALTSLVLSPCDVEKCRRSLARVEKFFSQCLPQFQVLVEVMMSVISCNKPDVNLRDLELEINMELSFLKKFRADAQTSAQVRSALFRKLESLRVKDTTLWAVSGILVMLLKWFKASHILKSFYFGTVLVDSQFFSVFIEFISDSFNNNALQKLDNENTALSSYEILAAQNKLINPKIQLPQFDFFRFCLGHREAPSHIRLLNSTPVCRMKHQLDDNGERVVHTTEFNHEFCAVLTNLFNVANELLIDNMSQRVIMFNETKPTDLMKIILLNFENDHLQTPILHIFKKLTPYQGRKWRASNMDVISRIYLKLRLSLKDDWLSGKDLESDFNSCYDQEVALRSLLQFYNMREYPEQMRWLGLTLAK